MEENEEREEKEEKYTEEEGKEEEIRLSVKEPRGNGLPARKWERERVVRIALNEGMAFLWRKRRKE